MTYTMCKDREETIVHLTSECSKLEYKKRHDKVAGAVHWIGLVLRLVQG